MNPSTAQGLVLVDELIRCGVTDVVLAPGSRSAPLATALAAADAAGRLTLHVRIDERSAGFLALGLAQVSGRAVVVVTTSGTAVVNLAPALTEASLAGVPVIALTADRPPELRDTGANQTIDQVKVFGSAIRWFHDLGVADRASGQVGYWRSVVDRAVDVAIEGVDPGPVHINVPVRHPSPTSKDAGWDGLLGLIPTQLDPQDLPDLYPRTVDGRLSLSAAQPLDEVLAPFAPDDSALADLLENFDPDSLEPDGARIDLSVGAVGDLEALEYGEQAGYDDDDDDDDAADVEDGDGGGLGIVPARGVVVVGHCGDGDHGEAAITLAQACGWPLIGEPSGNARSGDTTLTHGPLLLADEAFARAHVPEVVVVVGSVGLDRAVLALIARTPLVVSVDPRTAVRRPDPTRNTTVHVAVVPEPPEEYDAYDDAWLDSWLAADAIARGAVERVLDAGETLTGPDVARTVWDLCGPTQLLLAAASWPVRHLATFARVRDGADVPRVIGNRGASGIDGLVSTAWGAALAHQEERRVLLEGEHGGLTVVTTQGGTAYALLGDLAFLHDHNGLVVGAQEPRPDLVLVVVDNNGGGIFSQLEQAGSPHFERVFGTPHDLDLVAVAAAAGLPAARVHDVTGLVHALDEATAAGGVHVLVAQVGDRETEAALLREVQAAVSGALFDATTADTPPPDTTT